ncbi:alkylglycerol monooxygenase-like [Haliotis rufescens]|uniref:alkylglycerol monooxygenase-like n=1 Tax=Haliotis rufescens TaxID=6454 RepID=UPI00201FAA63|nr:alkylglycerol monooxygenase-like [Haliotis rufescens]
MEIVQKLSERPRRLLYLSTPNETSFETVEEVPEYVTEAIPYFVLLMGLEVVVLAAQGKQLPRANDAFSSISAGLLSLLHGLLFRAVELVCYIWVYDRFFLISLPWNSPWTWLLGFLGVDFGYYWVHRCGHEVNLLWAGHQAHHSSEDYNLTTALRQSAILKLFTWIFYMPMALCVPPSIFCVHNQFNLLYQFWIHTETIEKLGPLEYIINTPSHHRVHHGRNPYCIDKNYGGTLIVWDLLFGTFQQEETRVVYGLVHPLSTWEPITAQLCQLNHIITTAWRIEGLGNKLSVVFKGPGWEPGKPRLGCKEDLPQVESPVRKYDRSVPVSVSAYVWTHFTLILVGYLYLSVHRQDFSTVMVLASVLYVCFSLSTFGLLYDNWKFSPVMELVRCAVFIMACEVMDMPRYLVLSPLSALYVVYMGSSLLWGGLALQRWRFTVKGHVH